MHSIARHIAAFAALIATCLLAPASAWAEAPTTAAPAPPSPELAARPALWKVADEDTTIYLFGTLHALPAGIDWFRGPVAEAFDASGELVTEINETDPKLMAELVARHARLPQGSTLRAMLSPEEKASYEAAMAGAGLPVDAFDAYEPWYAAIALSTLPLLSDGFARDHGVEEALRKRAESGKRPHLALETAEYQLSLFDALPAPVQRRYLAEVAKELPTLRLDLLAMVEAWKRGDAETLAKLINQEEDDAALVEALLTGRNRVWAGWVRERMKEPGTVFLAVGAGHLAGPTSLQAQLAAGGIASARVQ